MGRICDTTILHFARYENDIVLTCEGGHGLQSRDAYGDTYWNDMTPLDYILKGNIQTNVQLLITILHLLYIYCIV